MRPSLAAGAAALVLGTLAIQAACKSDSTTDPCVPVINGLVAYSPGIDLEVRDASGRGQAFGDTAIAYVGTDSIIAAGYDTLHMYSGFGRPGTFAVRVKRKFYRETVVPSVVVKAGICGGPVLTVVPVQLELVPGAPALRSLAVFGAMFLYAPGVQSQLVARFDANPSVPTTVLWRLSDTTVAHIDASGLVTAKCTTKSAVDTVTVLAAIDTMVRASARFSVAQQTSCP